jgi:hypothetical protein
LTTWIREQSGYCKDLNRNNGGAGKTHHAVRSCGGSAWFAGGPTGAVVQGAGASRGAKQAGSYSGRRAAPGLGGAGGGCSKPPPKPLRITGVGRRGGEARRARRVDHEFHSVAQARAWTDGGCDAGRGFAFDGVGARPHRVVRLRHAREPTPGGPGSGLRRGRRRFLCQLPLWFYMY